MLILLCASAIMVIALVRRVYYDSLLQFKAKYNFSPVFIGMIVLGFLSPLFRVMAQYILFDMTVAALVMLTFLAGRNGLTSKGILLPNLLTRLLVFQRIVKVILKPIGNGQGRKLIVATFIEKRSYRQYALVFEMPENDLLTLLKRNLPSEAQIES